MKRKKVLIATPCYDGRLDVWYTNSLLQTVLRGKELGIDIHPVFMSFDALVQRARNDLISLAIKDAYDCMIFIDSDMEFDPEWVMTLIKRSEDVVGGTARKKTDQVEEYVAKTSDTSYHRNGLIKCEGLGTGFVKISDKALWAIWESSEPYTNQGRDCRMVCDVQVIDGELYSEDTVMFKKLTEAGFDCWLDPNMTCGHTGPKKYLGNMADWLKNQVQAKKGQNSTGLSSSKVGAK